MATHEQIEAALAQARVERETAAADRMKAGANWRKQDDANVTYDNVRSNWVQADAAWNRANAEIEKLTAALAQLKRSDAVTHRRAELEAAVAAAKIARDNADAALAAVARARAERENAALAVPAPVERRSKKIDRRKTGSDRRRSTTERRNAQAQTALTDSPAKQWNDAVANYNKAEADWNRARAVLAEFVKANTRR